MQNDKRLLSCPFCGGEAFVETHKFWDERAKDFTVQTYGVACHQCSSKSWQHCRTEEDAIKHWNTRKPMERIVEQLERVRKNDIMCEGCPFGSEIDCYIHCDEYKIMKMIEIAKGGVDNAE